MTKRIDFLPRVCEQCAPSVVLLIKVLLQFRALGATSPCMGKSRLQTERYCREPLGTATLSAPQSNIFDGSICTSATKQKNSHSQKRISHRAPSMMQTKICTYLGRSAVGTALVESGFGRETPFSVERGLSSKVFPSLSNPIPS